VSASAERGPGGCSRGVWAAGAAALSGTQHFTPGRGSRDRALLVALLPFTQRHVWVGGLFFCFSLSLATESFVSAAAQQAMTALMLRKKILAQNFSSKVSFGRVPWGSLFAFTGLQGWFFSCCHQASSAGAALKPAMVLQHCFCGRRRGSSALLHVVPGVTRVSALPSSQGEGEEAAGFARPGISLNGWLQMAGVTLHLSSLFCGVRRTIFCPLGTSQVIL